MAEAAWDTQWHLHIASSERADAFLNPPVSVG